MGNQGNDEIFSSSVMIPVAVAARTVILLATVVATYYFKNITFNVSLGLIFLCLTLAERAGILRWSILGLLSVNTALLYLLGEYLIEDRQVLYVQISATFTGVVLLNWYGATVSWPELKRCCYRYGFLSDFANSIDRGLFQAQAILDGFQKRCQSSFLRVGSRNRYPANVSRAIAGSIAGSLNRAQNIEEALYLKRNSGQSAAEVISLKNCSVFFKKRGNVLENITFELRKNQWLLITGPSGSGKTTILKLIAGLLKPDTGTIKPQRPLVGFIFQNPDDQFFSTTPYEDVYWGLNERGIEANDAAEKTWFWLKEMGVEHLAHHSLAYLSFGEKKRVALAGTLALEPDILLCDEPTAGLDFMTSKKLIETLESVEKKTPLSVVWVSHDLVHLPVRIENTLLIKEGQIVFYGPKATAMQPENLIRSGLR